VCVCVCVCVCVLSREDRFLYIAGEKGGCAPVRTAKATANTVSEVSEVVPSTSAI
jgi:hypothetical protein